ncbi:MAG: hypothetical protein RLZ10_981 [Bacteroidota bacterium]|jgi:hypothetical protein
MINGLNIGNGNGFAINGVNRGVISGLMGISSATKLKNIDPSLFSGPSKPTFYWNAESTVNTGYDTNISSVNGINCTQTIVINSDPIYQYDQQTNRGEISFDSNDSIYTSDCGLGGLKEFTTFIVCNIDALQRNILWKIDSTIVDTPGDVFIQSLGTGVVESVLYGNSSTLISVRSFLPEVRYSTFLITAKYSLDVNKIDNPHELYINGVKNMNVFSNNYTITSSDTFFASPLHNGANSSFTGGGNRVLSCLVLPYWVNESEQILIENWFRNYYGYKF